MHTVPHSVECFEILSSEHPQRLQIRPRREDVVQCISMSTNVDQSIQTEVVSNELHMVPCMYQ